VVQDSVINANNQENLGTHCSASCAQAGIKLGHMDSFTIEDNIFENNNGAGFWCDLACSHGVMIRNVSRNNQGDGLFYEVSDTGILASNLVIGNYGYGIRVGSANSYVVSNTVVNNNHYGALWIYDDSRSYGFGGWTDVGPDTVNTTVLNNVLVDTVGSNTLHRITAASTANTNTQPAQFFTAFDYNAYYRTTANQYLVRWIPSAGEIDYRSASAFTAAQGWDAHASDVADGGDPFVDLAHGDFHLQSSSPAYQSATDLPADVAAALGVPATATRSRGAITWPGE
jgi:hypothetical protein